MFRNINDDNIWTMDDMQQLRENEKINGFYIYEDFEEWLENKLENDFERI